MDHEVELVSDGDGVVVAGEQSAVTRFLIHLGALDQARNVDLSRVTTCAQVGSDALTTVSGVVEQSAMYLKLTPESAARLKRSGGLMKTNTKGISHAMLGQTGKKSLKWLQVEDGPKSLLTNPAVLSGVSGLLSQLAQQSEAQELKALLVGIDGKLDDVRRRQRDAVLATMRSSAAAIEEAMTIHGHGGDPQTLWDKVSASSEAILNVQEDALLALEALADKVEEESKPGGLKRATQGIEGEVAVQLAILARCFELQDQFRVVELDYVMATAPDKLEGHRCGLEAARATRRATVLDATGRLMGRLDAAGAIANESILLHARAARSVIGSLNATAAFVDDFHAPLGIATNRSSVTVTPWREALNDPAQRRVAGKEVGQKAAVVGVGAMASVALLRQVGDGKGSDS
ncbi:MAG: hypothetical protein IPJ15_08040 [Actinomycetales bacterium]|nr:hypothetical protein [Candidatus Phosphoribacter baldrii]